MSLTTLNRGAEWRRWDPHIHTPGTVKNDRFQGDWDGYPAAINAASPAIVALGVTDYGVTTSYERMVALRIEGKLPTVELMFPNVELRLNVGTVKGNFINVHLLASPEDPNHIAELNRFLGKIEFKGPSDTYTCTPGELMRLGRNSGVVVADDAAALEQGFTQFKVDLDELRNLHRSVSWARDNLIIAVAGGADGTSGLKDAADATVRVNIEKGAHVVFSGNPNDRAFWLGRSEGHNVEYIRTTYGSLKPCIWGCDAHQLSDVGKPAEDRFCWIKGTPSFDALRQAIIDPDRAFIGSQAPAGAANSQIIDSIEIKGADWATTPRVLLNPGLVAVIGARGSGKTALADMIAAGADAYSGSQAEPSFLKRAREHLSGSTVDLTWVDNSELVTRHLDAPVNRAADAYPRARYLSQQFVEELCSVEGMPKLIREIERVIFQAHPLATRDGALTFADLLELRASGYRQARVREEEALANISDQIGIEMEKTLLVEPLKSQIDAKKKLLDGLRRDRKAMLPKATGPTGDRLQALAEATEKVNSYLRYYNRQLASLSDLAGEVADTRQNRAPEALRALKERRAHSGMKPEQWPDFLLKFSGDVDVDIKASRESASRAIAFWKGITPTKPLDSASGAFIADNDDLTRVSLAVLGAESERLGGILLSDRELAKKIAALGDKITTEAGELEQLEERFKDAEGAKARAATLVKEREAGYERVFDAVIGEETVLRELYAPLMTRLAKSGGTLNKLSFTVNRAADVRRWADYAEKDIFDLRTAEFRGFGSLERAASEGLSAAWQAGSPRDVSAAMAAFQNKNSAALLERSAVKRDDPRYRPWSRRFAQWLYSTGHISLQYAIQYDGIDIQKLSPGTRGIVLVLLYLALDENDTRPLIIDQPEENLDPKSIHEELVPLFQEAKRKRQVIMVTHNANLVVNTDADQIIVADVGRHTGEGLPPIAYTSGGMDESGIRKQVTLILEGGKHAFRERARRLRIALDQTENPAELGQ